MAAPPRPFRDDFAKRLIDKGVAVELHVIPGAYHGFENIPTATLGKSFRAVLLDAFRRAFAVPAALRR